MAGPEALQRQLLYERERGLLGGLGAAGAASLAATQQLQQLQQEEYLRYSKASRHVQPTDCFTLQTSEGQGIESEDSRGGCQAGWPEIVTTNQGVLRLS